MDKDFEIEIVDEDVASLYNILVVNEHKMKFLSNETLDEDALLDNTWDSNAKLKDTHIDKFLQTKYDEDELDESELYSSTKSTFTNGSILIDAEYISGA